MLSTDVLVHHVSLHDCLIEFDEVQSTGMSLVHEHIAARNSTVSILLASELGIDTVAERG